MTTCITTSTITRIFNLSFFCILFIIFSPFLVFLFHIFLDMCLVSILSRLFSNNISIVITILFIFVLYIFLVLFIVIKPILLCFFWCSCWSGFIQCRIQLFNIFSFFP